MASDYRDIKKGIKQVELDRIRYNTKIFFCIIAGIMAGVIAHKSGAKTDLSIIIGLVVLFGLGIKSARTYFEMKKGE